MLRMLPEGTYQVVLVEKICLGAEGSTIPKIEDQG